MHKKVNYPTTRKAAERVTCPLCEKFYAARGIESHLRMGHYKEVADFYAFLIDMYKTGDGNKFENSENEIRVSRVVKRATPITTSEVENLIIQLSRMLSGGKLRLADIPPDLKKVMNELGWNAESPKVPPSTQDGVFINLRDYIIENGDPRLVILYSNEIREVTFKNYEQLVHLHGILEERIEKFKEQFRRYRDNPVLLDIETGTL
jgi:hypothetical protein